MRAQDSHTTWVSAGPDAVWIEAASVPDLTETGALPDRPYSTRTHTEWAFLSGHTGETALQTLPVVQVDHAVATDLSGKAGRRSEVTVTPSHLAGVAGSRFRSVTLDVSYDDGATWHRTDPAHGGGDGVRFRLDAPARARFVTLPASACLRWPQVTHVPAAEDSGAGTRRSRGGRSAQKLRLQRSR
ncbi:hypothetical protein [Streptomyces aquilus]|uniref:hypothetical protein n=1 Tax=Streptomyces aquilus TaxID=2548456 RepID=UPI0036887C17